MWCMGSYFTRWEPSCTFDLMSHCWAPTSWSMAPHSTQLFGFFMPFHCRFNHCSDLYRQEANKMGKQLKVTEQCKFNYCSDLVEANKNPLSHLNHKIKWVSMCRRRINVDTIRGNHIWKSY